MELEAAGEIDVSAEVPIKKIMVAGQGELKWTSKATLKVRGNGKVPSAIQGWII